MPNGRSSAQERAADGARATRQLTNAPPSLTTTPYLATSNARESLFIGEFTDEEEENDPTYDPNEIRLIARDVGEDVVRTGEASRLRRRGAVHGRRPQLPYVTLVCGAPLPWRFKFNQPDDMKPMRPSGLRSLMQRYESLKRPSSSSSTAQDLPLEFPSTGCRTILTNRAYVSPTHRVYSAQVATGSVRRVDRSYLDMEQRSTLVEFLMNSWGQLDWQGLACSSCGNIIGFRYAPAVFDEQGKLVLNGMGPAGYTPKERFVFFASAVTSSKPYDFATQRHYSYPYHWRYLEPLTTTPIVSPNPRSSLGPRTPSTTVSHPQDRLLTAVSQDLYDSISFPIASSDEAGLQSQQEYALPSWSPSSSDELLSFEEELGPNNLGPEPNNVFWVTWPSNPIPASNDVIHPSGEPSLAEVVSVHRSTHTQDDSMHSQSFAWHPAIAIDLQSSGLSSTVQPHESNEETMSETEAIDPSSDTLQDQHAPNVLPAGSEHEVLGSAMDAVTEVQASDDHHTNNTGANSTSASSQQPSLHLLNIELSNPFRADDSHAYQTPERVQGMAYSESDTIDVQDAVINPAIEPNTTTVQNIGTLDSFSALSSTLPTPLPIAYESPATVVDVEASNEITGEVENLGILIEVASPPSDATSSFGSAVVVPSLVPSSRDFALTRESPQLSSAADQSRLFNDPSESISRSVSQVEIPQTLLNDAPFDTARSPDAIVASAEDLDSNTLEPFTPSSFHHYTPPLPQLSAQDLVPSLPTTPLNSFTSPYLPFDPASLLTFPEDVDDELISVEPSNDLVMGLEGISTSQSLEHAIEVSAPRNENEEMSRSYLEQASSTAYSPSHSSDSVRSPVEEHADITFVSRYQSPSPSSPSSPRVIAAAPVSHPQPLPVNSSFLNEVETVSRHVPRHALPRSSSSQHRSSSRRSWRIPRELDECPLSSDNDGEDQVESSVSRLRSRSRHEPGSISRNERRPTRGLRPSPSVSRRTGGYSRARRRLSSSSRRDSLISSASLSTSGPVQNALPSNMVRIPNQLRAGVDTLYRHSNLNPASPELTRRGSLPNIQRPRLSGLVRRDSLPVLPVQRQPLSDLTATFRQHNRFTPPAHLSDSAISHTSLRPETIEDHSPLLNQRYRGERLLLEVDRLQENEPDSDTRPSLDDSSEQENEPIIDPEDALTPRPRRHTTMPVFIPSPPSDSESELEDNIQPFSRGRTVVPWMPWEWCRQRFPLDNGLQIELDVAPITGEGEDKEE